MNANRRGTAANMGTLLSMTGLGKPRDLPPPGDPPVSTLVTVDITLIDTCDLNPRQQKNEAFFNKLKEAIRVNGLDTPIPITRRPGSDRYMVAAGGNTRLQVLRELSREEEELGKGDKKFLKAPCIFKPYTSDIDILAAHLRENDLRDNLVYIDHALAIVTLRRMLEEGRAAEGLSELKDTDYEDILRKQMGHPVSRREIGRMGYTVSVLWPVIPNALRNGAGQSLVDSIGKLQNVYLGVYQEILRDLPKTGSYPEFGTLFADSLQVHDDDSLDLEAVKAELDLRISQYTGVPANKVRLVLDEQLAGRMSKPETKAQDNPSPGRARTSKPGIGSGQSQPQGQPVPADGQPTGHEPQAPSGKEPRGPSIPEPQASPGVDVFASGGSGQPGPKAGSADLPLDAPEATPEQSTGATPTTGAPSLRDAASDGLVLRANPDPIGPGQHPDTRASEAQPPPRLEQHPALPNPAFPAASVEGDGNPVFAFEAPAPDLGMARLENPEPPGNAFPPSPAFAVQGNLQAAAFPIDEAPIAEAFPPPAIPPLATVASQGAELGWAEQTSGKPNPISQLRSQIAANADLLIRMSGVAGLRAFPDHRAAGGFTVIAQQPAASDKESTLWWLLASLSGGGNDPDGCPSALALLQQLFLRFDNGIPPSDDLLRQLFQLIESVVAYARAAGCLKKGDKDQTMEQRTEE